MSRNSVASFCAIFLGLFVAHAEGADLYVSPLGLDENPGTLAQPLRTIGRAYSFARPGTTIVVMPGLYTDYTGGWGLRLGASGTASSPIVLRSQVKGAAIIDGLNASNRNAAIYLDGSYNVVDGFDITGGPNGGIKIWGNGNQIINNDIHHNGNPASTNSNGHDGVYSGPATHHNVFAGNYIHDNGRSGSNLDHGLYLCGDNELVADNVSVRNATTGLQIAGYTTVSKIRVYNNVIAFNGSSGIILWQSLSGVDIKNNIIYRNGTYGINSWDAHGSGVVIDRNLLFDNASGDYNLTRGGSDFSYVVGATISGEPLLVSPDAAAFDSHLKPGSPAINAGLNLASVFRMDKDGAGWPAAGAWDLGSYRHGSDIEIPPASEIGRQFIYLPFEAESATLAPPLAVAQSPDAAEGQFVVSSMQYSGSATFNVNIPVPGVYSIWSRVLAPDESHDSFYVSVDDGSEDIYDTAEGTRTNGWQWTVVNGRGGGGSTTALMINPRKFWFNAGEHSIVFRGREVGTGLDQILLTNDPDYVPKDILSARTPPLRISTITPEAGGFVTIRWRTVPGNRYRLACKANLNDLIWIPLGPDQVASGTVMQQIDRPAGNRYYSVLTIP